MPSSSPIVEEVRATLQGPVMRILCRLVPELAEFEPEPAYERVMDDVKLLTRCFESFRQNRKLFAHLLVDARDRPVGDDDDLPLACGRTVNEVVGMVVRSATRRYFRRRLPSMVRSFKRSVVAERRGVMTDLLDSFLGSRPTHPPGGGMTQGDLLYREIADYLDFDWQVPLIPAYSKLSVSQVRRLGPVLREVRTEAGITESLSARASGRSGSTLPLVQAVPLPPVAPAPEPVAKEPPPRVLDPVAMSEQDWILARLIDAQGNVRPHILEDGLDRPLVRAAIAASPLRKNAVLPPEIGAGTVMALVKLLDFREEQVAIMLLSAYAMLGWTSFKAVFGKEARPTTVAQLIERARATGIGRYTEPAVIADFTEKMLLKARAKLARVA